MIVKSYAAVLPEYECTLNTSSTAPTGSPARRNTHSLLQRRRIDLAVPVRLIGKEANNIDEAQAGCYAHIDEIINEYPDPSDDHFHPDVMPLLDHLSGRELARLVGIDRRTIDRIRNGQIPRAELRQALTQVAKRFTR